MTIVGYDRERVRALRARVVHALDALRLLGREATGDWHAREVRPVVGRMTTLLEHGFLAAVDLILRDDPLHRLDRPVGDRAANACTVHATEAAAAFSGPHSHLSDFDLLATLWDLQREHGGPRGELHTFWTTDFPAYADEIAHRLATSPSFVEEVSTRLDVMPIVTMILATHPIPDDVVTFLAHGTLAAADLGPTPGIGALQDRAVEVVLAQLADAPRLALAVLGEPGATSGLLAHDQAGHASAADAVAAAFAGFDGSPTADGRIAAMLRAAADDAAGRHDRSGFPSPIAAALASGVAGFAPVLGRHASGSGTWVATASAPSDDTLLTSEQLDELLGALLRDPVGGATLFVGGFELTARATHEWIDLAPDARTVERSDARAFAQLLERAVAHEQVEEEAARASIVGLVSYVVDGADVAIDLGTRWIRPITEVASDRVLGAIEAVVAGSIRSGEIGAAGFAGRFDEVERVEIVRDLLDRIEGTPGGLADSDAERVAELHDALGTFDDALRTAETQPVDLDTVVAVLEDGYRDLEPSPRWHRSDIYDAAVGNDDRRSAIE